MGGQIGNAMPGTYNSMPKMVKVNADDSKTAIYRNMGNNHAYPMMFAGQFTVASGTTEETIMDSVTFHGFDLATYAKVTATPMSDPGARVWIEKSTGANTVKIKVGSATSGDVVFDVLCMLGEDIDVTGINCRGNNYQPE